MGQYYIDNKGCVVFPPGLPVTPRKRKNRKTFTVLYGYSTYNIVWCVNCHHQTSLVTVGTHSHIRHTSAGRATRDDPTSDDVIPYTSIGGGGTHLFKLSPSLNSRSSRARIARGVCAVQHLQNREGPDKLGLDAVLEVAVHVE